jgi:hypothetical protein
MNSFATRMMSRWRTIDPEGFAAIEDPETFFSSLAAEAEIQIQDTQTELAGPDLPDEQTLGKVGRLNAARSQAEEIVLAEMLPVGSSDSTEEPEENPVAIVTEVQAAIDRAGQELPID